ncbi:RagB/SusD family nutrient uptake outer membrane protein [Myroides odoratimimus]|uniref:RagB/SusD family nutrient uptake outer membrane protein n=1 Tax=Myroides odoratimimus TaxID=76832 RepID=UPI000A6C7070|nr:RagB/SusD family nutrient uptake outer membrane protein [Myroides odoratimimus]
MYYASQKLRDQFDSKNHQRHEHFFGKEDNAVNSKYDGSAFNDRINDYKVFRISEIYLIRAEAYLKLGNNTSATNDINTLRDNRIKDNTHFTTVTLQERFLELSFEGHRYFDLKRLGLSSKRDTRDLAVNTDNKVINAFDEYYQLPILQKEVQANPALKY